MLEPALAEFAALEFVVFEFAAFRLAGGGGSLGSATLPVFDAIAWGLAGCVHRLKCYRARQSWVLATMDTRMAERQFESAQVLRQLGRASTCWAPNVDRLVAQRYCFSSTAARWLRHATGRRTACRWGRLVGGNLLWCIDLF